MMNILAMTLLGLATLTLANTHSTFHVRDFDLYKLADDATWDKYKCKGSQLVQAMKGTDAEAGQLFGRTSAESEFKGEMKQDLATWAWTDAAFVSYMLCDLKSYWNLGTACEALGLKTAPKLTGGDNTCYKLQHFDPSKKDDGGTPMPKSKQTYKVGEKEYRVTGAELELAVNLVGGVIFQQYVTSPKTAAGNLWNKKPELEELPKLRALSDIMWAVWNRDNPNTKNIRYFWVQGVGNTNSKALIARALKGMDKKLEKWPGVSFDMDEDAGRAILASENAACFAYLLSQHKAELGMLTINKVTVFKNDLSGNVDPDLVFQVAAVPELKRTKRGSLNKDAAPDRIQPDGYDAEKHVARTHAKWGKVA